MTGRWNKKEAGRGRQTILRESWAIIAQNQHEDSLSFFPTLLLCSTSPFLTSGARINLSFFFFFSPFLSPWPATTCGEYVYNRGKGRRRITQQQQQQKKSKKANLPLRQNGKGEKNEGGRKRRGRKGKK